jgi:glutamate-1-semialdehyde 2,1-aminomutase
MEQAPLVWVAIGLAVAVALPWAHARSKLSRAKHPSLAGHSKWSRRIAKWVPRIDYDARQVLCVDNAPEPVVARRRAAMDRLAAVFAYRYPSGAAMTAAAARHISDVQLTAAYRVPFPFSRYVRERFKGAAFVQSVAGNQFVDCDGNRFYDLTASYGVNVFGNDTYRRLIAEGAARVEPVGAVLGVYHPIVAQNAARLAALSGQDEVSFHMSGTEAVMQAVRLARYHTGRRKVVRFCGSYHGWWGDVQPGAGNPHPADDTYTLKELDDTTLEVLRTRRDIACVLVNPLQALHPNSPAPADSALIDSSRRAGFDRSAYAGWLARLREVCAERGIAFIIDDVFTGFRLARGGAQEYFGVRADMVTYGKSLGGGLPIGAVAGKAGWMRRFSDARPAHFNFARGTFNSHPHVMGAMAAFLDLLDRDETRACYADLDRRWARNATVLNRHLRGLPVRVANLSSIFTVLYDTPSRYNWMLQYYLKEQGLALPLVGTGRFMFSFDYTDADVEAVAMRFAAAAKAMKEDGWWWAAERASNRTLRRDFLKDMLAARLAWGGAHEPVPAAAREFSGLPHPDRSTAP